MTDQAQSQMGPFSVERIYVRDISFEAPAVPAIFNEAKDKSDLSVQLGIRHRLVNEATNLYEVVLEITAKALNGDKTIFLIEVQQAGLFALPPMTGDVLQRVLEIECPHVLLPFARETINELAGKGGFPQLLITPINFAALYAQKQASKEKQSVQ